MRQAMYAPHPTAPWLLHLREPYNPAHVEWFKDLPGCTWDKSARARCVPLDMEPLVTQQLQSEGLSVYKPGADVRTLAVDDATLHQYQRAGVVAALLAPGHRWIFADDTGLGKTPQALVAAATLKPARVLIVTLAIVRDHWLRELDKWWPGHPEASSILLGRGRIKGLSKPAAARRDATYAAPIQVVSYNLLHNCDLGPWDVIIFDEAHRLGLGAEWSRAAQKIVLANPGAAVFGLTATLQPNKVLDIASPVDVIWPGRVGPRPKAKGKQFWTFANRYSNASHNGYGIVFNGVNEVHADELAHRLSCWCSRTTKAEVAHLLPPFDVSLLPVNYTGDSLQHVDTRSALARAAVQKIPFVADWVENALANATHVAVHFYHKEAAEKCFAALQHVKRLPKCYLITGDALPEERNELLRQAAAQPGAVVVDTMCSVGIGIDLTFCPLALIAELYTKPETIEQLLGRHSRLSGKVQSHVDVMVLSGTQDELAGQVLLQRMQEINRLQKLGGDTSTLLAALDKPMSEDEFMAALDKAIASTTTDEYEVTNGSDYDE